MVEMFKQSHRNLGANFISSDSDEMDSWQVQGYVQSRPLAADGLNDDVLTGEDQGKREIQGKNEVTSF